MFNKLFLLLNLLTVSAFATDVTPPPPVATWKSSVATVGDLPSSGNTAGDARVVTSTGALYAWNGSSWVSGGGSGSVSIGSPIAGAPPGGFLYTDSSSNLFADSGAFRLNNNTFDTSIKSYFLGASATTNQNDQFSTVNPQANAPITLVFNGTTDTCASVLAAWNTANPTNQAIQTYGSGSDIPAAQTVILGSGQAGFLSGDLSSIGFGGAQGFGSVASGFDGINSVNLQGNLFQLLGVPGVSEVQAILNTNTGSQNVDLKANGRQLFVQDGSGNSANLTLDTNQGINLSYNNLGFYTNGTLIGWLDGTDSYFLPTGVTPSMGQVLSVTAISGNDYSLGFVPPSSGGLTNGTQWNQFLTWNQGSTAPQWTNFYGFMDDSGSNGAVILGWKAGGVLDPSFAPSSTPGYANTLVGSYAFPNANTLSQFNRNSAFGTNSGGNPSSAQRFTALGYQAEETGGAIVTDVTLVGADNIMGSSSTDQIIVAIGVQNQTSGSALINIGNYNNVYSQNNYAFGNTIQMSSATTGVDNIFIGNNMILSGMTSASNNFAVGFGGPGNITSGSNNLLFYGGYNLTSGQSNFVWNGGSGLTTGQFNIELGSGVGAIQATGSNNLLIGNSADTVNANDSGAIALGDGAKASSNQFVAGSNNSPISDVYFGTGQYANSDYTIHGSESLLPAPAANTPGGSLNLLAGHGVGTGYGGNLRLGSSFPGSSGVTANPTFWGFILNPTDLTLQIGDPYNQLSTGIATLKFNYSANMFEVINPQTNAILQEWDGPNQQVVMNSGQVNGAIGVEPCGAVVTFGPGMYHIVYNSCGTSTTNYLPTTCRVGEEYMVSDGSYSFATYPLTMDSQAGNTIIGQASSGQTYVMNQNGQTTHFKCFDNSVGALKWVAYQ